MLRATTESAVRAALTTVVDTGTAMAVHTAHVATTPVRVASNALLAVGISLATTLIVGAIEYSVAGIWWLGASVGGLAWTGAAAVGSVAYNGLFGAPQPKMITWHDSYDKIWIPPSKSTEDSTRLLEDGATSPRSPSAKPSLMNID